MRQHSFTRYFLKIYIYDQNHHKTHPSKNPKSKFKAISDAHTLYRFAKNRRWRRGQRRKCCQRVLADDDIAFGSF